MAFASYSMAAKKQLWQLFREFDLSLQEKCGKGVLRVDCMYFNFKIGYCQDLFVELFINQC